MLRTGRRIALTCQRDKRRVGWHLTHRAVADRNTILALLAVKTKAVGRVCAFHQIGTADLYLGVLVLRPTAEVLPFLPEIHARRIQAPHMVGARRIAGTRHVASRQVGNGGAKLKWPPSTHPDYRALAEACMHREVSVRPKFEDIVPHIQKLQARLKEGAFSSSLEGVWD